VKAVVQTEYGEPGGMFAAFLASGDVRVVIDQTYALDAAPAAVAHMLGHHGRGKVVIAV
jgi:NADPH:quinone reductase-like Zn-dependent oxidoreductase